MTEPASRPRRPLALIAAVVVLSLAAMFFAMTARSLGGENGGLPSLALLISLLAVRFNWARITALVLLAFQTVTLLPGAVAYVGDPRTSQAASYALIGSVLFVAGAVMACLTPSNRYYREAKQSRRDRKRQDLQT